jgi:O-antigen/teichoic acid export membrane protein
VSALQGSITEAPLAAAPHTPAAERAPRAVSGAALLSGATVASGVLTYAFLVLAARELGPAAYGRIGALWGAMFITAIVFFRPLEQTLSRSIADRRARGEEVRSVAVAVGVLAVVLVGGIVLVAALAWGQLTERLFGGQSMLTALLVAGIVFYGLSYIVRGLVGGVLWFNGYGINLLADGLGRLVLGLPLLFVASTVSAGIAVAGAGLIAAIAPLLAGRRRLGTVLDRGPGERFEPRRAFRFALPACAIAASDQLLVNGAPLLVMAGGGPRATKMAGLAFAATMLVRAPVYVYQGVAAAILPNLTRLNATDGLRTLRAEVVRTARLLVGLALIVIAACTLAGPVGMRILYGGEYSASRSVFLALGIGVAFYLVGATLSQAMLAVDAGRQAAGVWIASAAALAASYAALPGSELLRVGMSFAVGSFVLVVGLSVLLVREGGSS